jgi:hypothetical protein
MSAAVAGVQQPLSNDPANLSATSAQSVPYQSGKQGSISFATTGSRAALRVLPPKSKDPDSARSVEVTEAQKNDPNSKKLLDAALLDTFRDSKISRSVEQSQGRNTEARNALISATGREFGPDIALKVVPNIDDSVTYPDQYISKIITKDSSITEVLNILAFLLNNGKQRNGSIIKKFSYENHFSANTGLYWYPTNAPFDITKLTTAPSAPEVKITIPGTFLRRDESYELKDDIPIEYNQIQPLISACILQMINILENTREVFGGWAKLFKGMQGGSSKSKTKKTRRRYNRRH